MNKFVQFVQIIYFWKCRLLYFSTVGNQNDACVDIAAANDVVYVLRRTTVRKEYVTPVLLSSVLFVNKVLPTLFVRCDNGSEKGTGDHENEHKCDSLL